MRSQHSIYSFASSLSRIDSILKAEDAHYKEVSGIPPRTSLTSYNGFYVKCCALFIDVCDSSTLPTYYRRPTLAKIYRAFISECVAIINSNPLSVEVNIHGDAVWGVFDTTTAQSVSSVFDTAAQLHSLVRTLDCKLKRAGMQGISAGIGLTYGQVLMVKAGLGTTINEVVWMGDVVNLASNLAGLAARGGYLPLLLTPDVYNLLPASYQGFLKQNTKINCYEGDVISREMDEWYKQNCV